VKRTVLAGMLRPMAKVSVAKRACINLKMAYERPPDASFNIFGIQQLQAMVISAVNK
jgi:hypothetical protein